MFTDEELFKSISRNMKKFRLLNKLSQAEIAEMLSIDTQYYSPLERAERNFSLEKVALACIIYNLQIEDIVKLEYKSEEKDRELEIKRQNLIVEITSGLDSLTSNQLKILSIYLREVLPFSVN